MCWIVSLGILKSQECPRLVIKILLKIALKMRNVFIISAVLLVFVLVFHGVYTFVFKQENYSAQQPSQSVLEEVSIIPETAKQSPKQLQTISSETVLGAVFDKKEKTILYCDPTSGTIWKIDPVAGEKQQVSTTNIKDIKSLSWSSDRKSFLAMSEENGKTVFYRHDLDAQEDFRLKSGLDSAAWDNLGVKIFYKYYDSVTGKRSLNVSNPDGNDWKYLADIEHRNVSIAPVPLTSHASFWNFPDADEETKFSIIGTTGGEVKVLLTGKFGSDYLWSPGGSKALVSSSTERGGRAFTLGIINFSGEYTDLQIPTLVSKCAWSEDEKNVYYALPGGIPENAVMPNDYQKGNFNTKDTFWKIDLETGKKERIIEAEAIDGEFDSANLFLSSAEDALYFTNKIDGKLYKINLK